MATPTQIIDKVASLMNDTAKSVYTDAACLPYLNIALDELQEEFELHNVPVTNEVSGLINCPAGTTTIGFAGGPPILPANLIEIQQLWESPEAENKFIPMDKKEFLPHYKESGQPISRFQIWAWMDEEITLIAASVDIDLKIDYVKSIFATPVSSLSTDLGIKNSKSYLTFKTASLCSRFVGANPTRADELDTLADGALGRVLGISIKGRQAITTRRRPFMASYRSRGR